MGSKLAIICDGPEDNLEEFKIRNVIILQEKAMSHTLSWSFHSKQMDFHIEKLTLKVALGRRTEQTSPNAPKYWSFSFSIIPSHQINISSGYLGCPLLGGGEKKSTWDRNPVKNSYSRIETRTNYRTVFISFDLSRY